MAESSKKIDHSEYFFQKNKHMIKDVLSKII